jgi:hypothetical protein
MFDIFNTMSIYGSVDESGLVNNVLKSGIQLDYCQSIKELIDNSIDANATKIKIIIDLDFNINSIKEFSKQDKIIPSLIYLDNGTGMNPEKANKYLSLCTTNIDNTNNGFYGLGGKASLINICNTNGNQQHKFSQIITSFYDDSEIENQEIYINWGKIYQDKNNKKVWTENTKFQNSHHKNVDLWNLYKLGDTGCMIITTISKDRDFLEFLNNIKENITESEHEIEYPSGEIMGMLYQINRTYYYLLDKLSIDFIFKNNNKEYSYSINDDNCDTIHFNEIKNRNKQFKSFHNEYIDDTFRKSFEMINEYNIYFDCWNNYYIKTINSNIEKHQNTKFYWSPSQKLKDDFNDSEIDKLPHFNYKVCWCNSKDIGDDSKKLTDYYGHSDGSKFAGLYLKRNKRIIADPFGLHNLRNTQDGNGWRAVLDITPEISHKFHLGVNKSIFKKENITDKCFVSMITSITKKTVDKCRDGQSPQSYCKNTTCRKHKDICECNQCKSCKMNNNSCICQKCVDCNYKKCKCKDLICVDCSKIDCICHLICKICDSIECKCKVCEYCGSKHSCKCLEECNICNKLNYECLCCDNCHQYLECKICENCSEKLCLHKCNCKLINGDWQNKINNSLYRNNREETYDIVYLVQEEKYWNTDIYKIGRTVQNINNRNMINRFQRDDYGGYLKIIMMMETKNCIETEKIIIEKFRNNFSKYENSRERFQGNIIEMKKLFINITLDYL